MAPDRAGGDATDAHGDAQREVPDDFLRLREDARRELAAYRPRDADQEEYHRDLTAFVAGEPGALWRDGPRAHVTASCLVLDHTGTRVLLTLHRKARLWLQLGGHVEAADRDVRSAAEREAREESSLAALVVRPGVVDLHRHALSSRFGHCREHLDLRYLAVAAPGAVAAASAESEDLAWWPVDALPPDSPAELRELVAAGVAAFALATVPG